MIKNCRYCNAEFKVRASRYNETHYCSTECRVSDRNSKIVYYDCDSCGVSFKTFPSELQKLKDGTKQHLFCSVKCYRDYQKADIIHEIKCKLCSKIVVVPSYLKDRKKYCSHECMSADKAGGVCNCDYCGKSFVLDSHTYGKRTGDSQKPIHCSHECRVKSKLPSIEEINETFEKRDCVGLCEKISKLSDKVPYICNKHKEKGVQTIRCDDLINNKHGCKYCGYDRTTAAQRMSIETVAQKFAERNLSLISTEYENAGTELIFICNAHKEVGEQKTTYRNLFQKDGCKFCSMDKLREKMMYSYDYVKETFSNKNLTLISKEYTGNNDMLEYICNIHPELSTQTTALTTLLAGGIGCRACANKNIREKQMLSDDEFKKRVRELHEGKVIPLEKYNGADNKIMFACTVCDHRWCTRAILVAKRGSGCPLCALSKGEKVIEKFLKENNIPFVPQKSYEGLLGLGGGQLSYDFYLCDDNILIEYQGEFHDGTTTKQTKDEYIKQQEHDKRKKQYAEQNNIELFEIWYFDFENIKNILSDKLKVTSNK